MSGWHSLEVPMASAREPTILVVFGATGDLMSRKIVPALYHLHDSGRLPEHFRVIGFARRPFPDDVFRADVAKELGEHMDVHPSAEDLAPFLQSFTYRQGHFEEDEAYEKLGEDLKRIDMEWDTCANKLFYLAVPPLFYRAIFERLAASKLTEPCGPPYENWTRVLVEKPFGSDAHSAQELDELLSSLFREEQIYRIDHYLAKEMLQGIINFRFSNNLLEPTWNSRGIDKIECALLESIGVEDRGAFYEGVGALRDVGQNHLLQMLALVTMDQPSDLGAEAIRVRRAELLESLKHMSPAEVGETSYRAQYEGYREIPGVAPDSQTETYFKLQTYLENERWAGVPITLEAGKRIRDARKEIVVTFKHPSPCLCEGQHYENRVIFTLEPSESIRIEFFTKRPGYERELERRDFTFMLYEKEEQAQYVEEYSRLLSDAFAGDQTLFVSTGEVRAMWDFTDRVEHAWMKGVPPLHFYKPDTDEPVRAAAYIGRSRIVFPGRERNEIGILGLGKMGGGLARRLAEQDWRVVGWNRHFAVAEELAAEQPNAVAAQSVADLVAALTPPRVVWLMLPAGDIVENAIFGEGGLTSLLQPGDMIVDGGNSFFKDSQRRGRRLEQAGFVFTDVGVSGGPAGARWGACLMIGGMTETYERLTPLWRDIAREGAYRWFEGYGAGHFVKMVHNGIEYGMMQAIAEGFTVLKRSRFDLDLTRVTEIYNNGSVIESRLVGWLHDAFERHGQELEGVSGVVGHTGEGEWTVRTAEEEGIVARVISDALRFRIESAQHPDYTGQIVAALRESFGGHSVSGG
jgi:glucose-6-phosphate 1-dehydrogenase